MGSLKSLFTGFLLVLPVSSAQITSGGSASISGLMTDLLGLNFSEPYVTLGFAATFGLMWASVYVIFKVGVKKIDSGYGGRRSNPFGDALGLTGDSRNLLAVLTLLITLSMVGTGAFTGLIQGWQSLIILAFSFMLLAGLAFVLLGGSGAVVGGTAYVTGKSAKVASEGVQELQEQVDRIRSEEETLDDIEGDIEDEEEDAERRERRERGSGSRDGDDGSGSGRGRSGGDTGRGDDSGTGRDHGETDSEERTDAEIADIVRKLEKAIEILEDIEGRLTRELAEESSRIDRHLRALDELREVLESDEHLHRDVRKLIEELRSAGLDSSSGKEEFDRFIEETGDLPDILEREAELESYSERLRELESDLSTMEAELELLTEIRDILERLYEELGVADREEDVLEKLVDQLEHLRGHRMEELEEEVGKSRDEIKELENRFNELRKFNEKIKDLVEVKNAVEADHGDLAELISRLEEMAELVEQLLRASGSDFSSSDGFSFSPGADSPEGKDIEVSGLEEVLVVDCSLEPGSHTSEKPFEFYSRFRPLVGEFTPVMQGFIADQELYEEGNIGEGMGKVFQRLNQEISSRATGSASGRISLTSQLSGPSFRSHLANTVYLGFLVQNFWLWYRWHIADGTDTPRIAAKAVVREYCENVSATLVSYRTGSGDVPAVLVSGHGSDLLLSPVTGDRIDDWGSEDLGEILYRVED